MSANSEHSPSERPLPWSLVSGPLLLGHRGAPFAATENTAAALTGALDAGLHGFETDLQRTDDGALVLAHDPELASGEPIADLTLKELTELTPRMLTLEQLEELMVERENAVLNLEVKTSAPLMDPRAEELAEALKAWPKGVLARTWLSSFDPLLLLRLHEAGAPVPLAFLALRESDLKLLPCLPVVAAHPHFTLVTERSVAALKGAGLAVFTWTVNDEALARQLLSLGVDGLIGDHPELLLSAARGA